MPTDPMLRPVLAYATAGTWDKAYDILKQNRASLLTARGRELMHSSVVSATFLAADQPNMRGYADGLIARETFLARACEIGLEKAWAERQQSPGGVPNVVSTAEWTLDQLEKSLVDWLNKENYLDQRAMLADHPELLDPRIDGLLSNIIMQYKGQRQERYLRASLQWIQITRSSGQAAGWSAFCQAMELPNFDDESEAAVMRGIMEQLGHWLDTPTYTEQRQYLVEHPALLDPRTDAVLTQVIEQYKGKDDEKFLRASLTWLQVARTSGQDAGWLAFRAAMGLEQQDAIIRNLIEEVRQWLITPTYAEQRQYYIDHPALKDPRADAVMQQLITEFQGKDDEKFLRASLTWLQVARASGVEAGWQAFRAAMGLK